MAVNPLEGLMSIALNHQSVSGTTSHPFRGSNPVSLDGHRRSIRNSQESLKWCGSARNQHYPQNAARERSRVRNLRQAFHSLQAALPSVPPDTKLSKLDVLVLATNYIAYLTETLNKEGMLAEHTSTARPGGYLHPVKKWPMRSMLYCGSMGDMLSGVSAKQGPPSGEDSETHLLTLPLEGDKE